MPEERAIEADDGSLVRAFCAGERRAGAVLVERHFDALYQFFHSKVAGDVDDLVQQTFMSCLEARRSFRGECSFRTLLFRIARRRLYDHYRTKQRNRVLDFTTTSLCDLGTTPSVMLQRQGVIAVVREALQQLPLESQTLLELCYWQELSTRELAEVFEVPLGTIKSRLFAARAELATLVRARGYELQEGQLSAQRRAEP